MNSAHDTISKIALVVEDNEDDRNYYERVLTEKGFSIHFFDNGNEVLKYLRKNTAHIAIIHFTRDLRRSFNLVSKVYAMDPTICIISASNFSADSIRAQAHANGASLFFKRNSSEDKLKEKIDTAFKDSVERKRRRIRSNEVFVLMPFDETFNDIYNLGIRETIIDLGYSCNRADEIQFTGAIMQMIYQRIEAADIIIADMTSLKANVFYEVGYAHALGKTTILLTQNVDDIPFDLRDQRHIVYEGSIQKLREELKELVTSLF